MGSHRTWTGCSRIRWGGFRCTIRQRRRRSFDCVWRQRQTPLRMTDSIYLLLRRFDLPAPAVLSTYCGGSIYLLRRFYLLTSAVRSTYCGGSIYLLRRFYLLILALRVGSAPGVRVWPVSC